jgi:hypothetical protein
MSELATAPTEALPPTPSRASLRQDWIQRLERFVLSGLTAAPFCAHEGVSLASFYSWKRRLAPGTPQTPDAQPGPRLLPVHLTPTLAAVELVLPRGAVLRLLPGCDLAFVRSLVEALGDPPC